MSLSNKDYNAIIYRSGVTGVSVFVIALGLPIPPYLSLLILGGATSVLVIHSSRGLDGKGVAVFVALLGFVLVSILSGLLSQNIKRALITNLSWMPATFLFYLIATRFDLKSVMWLVWSLVWAALLLSMTLLFYAYTSDARAPAEWMLSSGYSHFTVPNDLLFLAVVAPFSVVLFLNSRSRYQSIVAGGALLLAIIVVVIFQSRGALITMLVSVASCTIMVEPRRSWVAMAVLLAIAIFADVLTGFSMSQKFLGMWSTRIPLWLAAWAMFLDAPLLGTGPGSFAVHGIEYINSIATPQWVLIDERHIPWPHNLYLEVLAERGLLGFIGLIVFIGLVLAFSWLSFQRMGSAGAQSLGAALFCGMLAIILGGAFELSILRYWLVVVLCLYGAIVVVLSSKL